jgi:peptidoglycan/LPS O-acetylase OafA/YrhL
MGLEGNRAVSGNERIVGSPGATGVELVEAFPQQFTNTREISRAHIPALDGLRGLAIALVLLTHLFQLSPVSKLDRIVVKLVDAGRHGVDLFFVLSGFLITGILLDTRSKPRYFLNFYGRRTLRIFPLYYCSLAVVFFVLPLLGVVQWSDLAPLRKYEWALWAYCSNIVIAARQAWVLNSGSISLDHFWSLAVEEQFYLVWPLIIAVLRRKALKNLCVALIVFAAVLRSVLAIRGTAEVSIMVLTPCRLDTLAVGALIALLVRDAGGIGALALRARTVFWGSLIALPICFGFHVVNDAAAQSISYSLLALFFGSLLVVTISAPGDTRISRIFGSRVVRFLGKYSYGLYVIHALAVPAFNKYFGVSLLSGSFGGRYAAAIVYLVLSCALSCGAAVLSWYFLEQPFLRLKRVFE